ncbi:hypothetical protein H5T87_00830 [bacterium]|nr:hypothetical protein [bacterium]
MKSDRIQSDEVLWVIAVGLVACLLFSLPYIVGAFMCPPNAKFLGLLRLKDDLAVYLSWIEQVRQGHIFFVNLFTNIPQKHPFFNIFALLMGAVSKLSNISPVKLLFISRYILAFILVFTLYYLISFIFPDKVTRKVALLLVLFSSGLGWLTGGYAPQRGFENSVDLWQPESTVFFILYVNPLFTFALILMLCFFLALLKLRGWKSGVIAGICLLVLANVHTYDILIVGLVWIFFIFALSLKERKIQWKLILPALIASLIAIPAIYYQIYLLKNEPLFAKRAEVPTLSPSFRWYLTGMGLLIPLALWGATRRVKERKKDDQLLFLLCWIVAGFILPYLPFSFQRKLFMGTQIPLALLSTFAICPEFIKEKRNILPFLLPFLFLSNIVVLGTDIYSLITNQPLYPQPNYISDNESEALEWLKNWTTPEETILAIPDFACYIPALCGRRVYAGHWGETPDYEKKYKEVLRFYKATDPYIKKTFLKENNIKFVYYGSYERFFAPLFPQLENPFLQKIYQNEEVIIWRVLD